MFGRIAGVAVSLKPARRPCRAGIALRALGRPASRAAHDARRPPRRRAGLSSAGAQVLFEGN
jgi:hypothetical protein